MRQVLLAPVENSRRNSRPILCWMDDGIRIGDAFLLQGATWVVSAVYGTHFSASASAARRERPPASRENGGAVPIDR
jgi:hypothetical protein